MPVPQESPVNHAAPPPEIFPIDVDAPPIDVVCYVYNKDGGHVLCIVSHGRRLLGSDNLVWLFGQPLILEELGYTLENPMPDASFQMYYHRSNDWLPLPEHNRPIIIQSGQALLWRRASVTTMPDLDSIIELTAVNSDPLPRSPNLPSTPIRGLFSLKSLTASPSLRAAVGLLNLAPSKPPRARFLVTVRPGRMARAGGKKPPQRPLPAPSSPSPQSSSPQSSSPPAPSQILRDAFGDNWKSTIPKRTSPPSSPRSGAKHRRSPSSEPSTISKRQKPATRTPSPVPAQPVSQALSQPRTPSPSGKPVVLVSPPDAVHVHHKKARPMPVNAADVIDISEDADDVVEKPRPSKGKGKQLGMIDLSKEVDEVVEMPRPRKGKGKAKVKVPIPADAEFIVLSD
ncbi:hypothetical protein GSI_08364 [Ganoderma sinense ZZ0214-1]|uniref:Uncharacterized protein n=1 Tax=Ganoderma sinense ZZ0214-1 TaxID=1077348 RepID=A0A2G8S709_9APHY|nr:hypothetical protein GSI_08364 [Ganoderma sinense ZZ0214-1]